MNFNRLAVDRRKESTLLERQDLARKPPTPKNQHKMSSSSSSIDQSTQSPTGSQPPSLDSSNSSSPPGDSRAPLGMLSIDLEPGSAYDPSLDGTSVASDVSNGVRPTDKSQLSEETIAEALRLKSEANKRFTASQYQEALDLYTLSINLNPFDATVWCNRSAVRLKREEHGLAIMDTSKAIELDPKYVKAYFRRATAQLSIMKPQLAIKDFKKCMSLDPGNAAAKVQLDATTKLVRRLDFEKAIASEDEEATSKRIQKLISEGACELDSSYAGPMLEKTGNGWKPSLKFIEEMLEWFKAGKTLPKRWIYEIILGCYEILKKEASLTEYTIPKGETCDVIGDTHGQFFDVLHLLSLTGLPSETHALVFNGDFVDRGSWSTEVVLTVFALKWYMPHKVFLNRGNHETADMNKVYGFEGETKKKYSELCYKLFEEVFCALPLCCLVTASQQPESTLVSKIPAKPFFDPQGRKRFFIVHGGLFSKDEVTFDELRKIPRMVKKQPGSEGLMMECLWTDPQDAPGRGPSKRGVGLGFGPDITENWCRHSGVTAVIRSHEVRDAGYSIEHDGRCITVFSAPNYVDQVGNQGGFVRINEHGTLEFTSYKHQPHPNIKPMAYAGGFMGLGGMI
ncbi:protein phosphatase 5 [Puccinia graminis f. sp. tritici CRL 75-36-700-3]|uniref:Serine/threonine-protein phosphatase n=2 Tax=Puccinia graminis f. sp. tritici TaxID=56615 RepID=E3JPX7_PUCGT|nr:protein phosphatase 5 [Puccinia graminis f. sp. tritici CRL 75-36-700-3]EFP74060.2 protein phosphatase 5 [Puccinia graminis f. sp. tritici CRL 75-36-700-3]